MCESSFINGPSRHFSPALFSDPPELYVIKEGREAPFYYDYVGVRSGDDLVLKCAAHSSEELTVTWTKNVRQEDTTHTVFILLTS